MKIKKKIYAILTAGLIGATLTGCQSKEVTNIVTKDFNYSYVSSNDNVVIEEVESTLINNELEYEEVQEVIEEEPILPVNYSIETIQNIVSNEDIDILDEYGFKLGTMPAGRPLTVAGYTDNTYIINYYGNLGYIPMDKVNAYNTSTLVGEIKEIMYATEPVQMMVPDFTDKTGEYQIVEIPALECFEIYSYLDDENMLVKTPDYIGYVSREHLSTLTGTFVVVDISNQELTLYKDNEVIFKTPVITGKPSTPSDQGLFEINYMEYERYLKGRGYCSYVDYFFPYNGGEGLHDAEYHSCNNRQHEQNHGWKNTSDFGGNTYLTAGSHGCINMLHDAVEFVESYVDVGTKVLVKE